MTITNSKNKYVKKRGISEIAGSTPVVAGPTPLPQQSQSLQIPTLIP